MVHIKISKGQRDSLSPSPTTSGPAVEDIPCSVAVGHQNESKSSDGFKVMATQDLTDFSKASSRQGSLPIAGKDQGGKGDRFVFVSKDKLGGSQGGEHQNKRLSQRGGFFLKEGSVVIGSRSKGSKAHFNGMTHGPVPFWSAWPIKTPLWHAYRGTYYSESSRSSF